MELLDRAIPLPLASAHPGVTVLALHGRMWRLMLPDGAVLDRAISLPLASAHPGVTVLALHGRMWRLMLPHGAVLGYVEIVETEDGERFLSKRLRPRAQGFLPVGEFWTADEAIESLRF